MIGYIGTILKYIWRKHVGARWLRDRSENLTLRFGGSLVIIERPGMERVTLEISCATRSAAHKLIREFGGSVEKLRPGWLQHFAKESQGNPLRIGSRLIILNTATQRTTAPRTLLIPAESAFGTGEHATTAMCLRLLERHTRKRPPGWSMLDAGTGSGILAWPRVVSVRHECWRSIMIPSPALSRSEMHARMGSRTLNFAWPMS